MYDLTYYNIFLTICYILYQKLYLVKNFFNNFSHILFKGLFIFDLKYFIDLQFKKYLTIRIICGKKFTIYSATNFTNFQTKKKLICAYNFYTLYIDLHVSE